MRDQPQRPGWYQFAGYVNGTDWDGEYAEVTLYSQYFRLCECEDESEARERLGPSPHDDDDPSPRRPPRRRRGRRRRRPEPPGR